MEDDFEITPLGMLTQAKIWHEIYIHQLTLDLNRQIVGVYSLFIAIEMYLKAYLILLDENFSKHAKLKNVSHSYKSIYDELLKVGDKKMLTKLKPLLKKYNLFEADPALLRYPKKGSYIFHVDLLSGDHGFNNVFSFIEKEVENKFGDWVKKK